MQFFVITNAQFIYDPLSGKKKNKKTMFDAYIIDTAYVHTEFKFTQC